MGSYNIRGHIICRMLYRCKGIDGLSQRKNDDTARMLSGGPAHSGTSHDDPVDLAVPFAGSPFFIVFFYIAKCSLVCQCTNSPCTEGLTCAEDNLRIFMRLGLVITGEIQVDIRLLVSLETKERLERNIKSFLI